MSLTISVTDLMGAQQGTDFDQYEGAEVTIPLCDSRTARVTIPLYEAQAAHVRPLDRMLKIKEAHSEPAEDDLFHFYGQITKVIWNMAAGTCEINAHDPSIRLKHHHVHYGDDPIVDEYESGNDGHTLDGHGFREIVDAARNSVAQTGIGVPDIGIMEGVNTSTDWPELQRLLQRGANVWDSALNLTRDAVGPEFVLRPVDDEDAEDNNGIYAILDLFDYYGEDKTEDVIFKLGFGDEDNLEDASYEPDGDVVVNNSVWISSGEADEDGGWIPGVKVFGQNQASWIQYGIYSQYNTADEKQAEAELIESAKATVASYGAPPDYLTITPLRVGVENALPVADGGPTIYRYMEDFHEGDTVRVELQLGYMGGGDPLEIDARITNVTLTQEDQSSPLKAGVTLVPQTIAEADVATGAQT